MSTFNMRHHSYEQLSYLPIQANRYRLTKVVCHGSSLANYQIYISFMRGKNDDLPCLLPSSSCVRWAARVQSFWRGQPQGKGEQCQKNAKRRRKENRTAS